MLTATRTFMAVTVRAARRSSRTIQSARFGEAATYWLGIRRRCASRCIGRSCRRAPRHLGCAATRTQIRSARKWISRERGERHAAYHCLQSRLIYCTIQYLKYRYPAHQVMTVNHARVGSGEERANAPSVISGAKLHRPTRNVRNSAILCGHLPYVTSAAISSCRLFDI